MRARQGSRASEPSVRRGRALGSPLTAGVAGRDPRGVAVRGVALVVLVALFSSAIARAQDAAPEGSAPPIASAVEAEAPAPDPEAEARHTEALARFDDAVALFERGDLEGALAEMSLVYHLLEGRPDQYVVFYNLGRLYEAQHRYDRAIELYERYLRESPPEGEDRADAEASLRALERLLGTLVVNVEVAAEVWIGDALVGEAPGEIRVPAGAHTIELRAAGYETHRREIELAARTRLEIDVTLARLSDVHGISPGFFVASTALAAIALGVGIGLGVHARDLSAAGVACAPLRTCPLGYDPEVEMARIRDVALGADVLYGTAALFAVASVVLGFVTDWGGATGATSEGAAALRVAPYGGPEGAGLALAGPF